MKIFYHDDLDGRASAFLIVEHIVRKSPEPIVSTAMNYGEEEQVLEIVNPDDEVFLLDFSVSPEQMDRLMAITEKVVWIDHHDRTIRRYDGTPHVTLPGIRRNGTAACELVWEWLKSGLHIEPGVEMPEVIRLVGDRDVWKWEFGEKTKNMFYGLQTEDTDPYSTTWVKACNNPDTFIHAGVYVAAYAEKRDAEYVEKYGYWATFCGYVCYVVNGHFSSTPFETVVPDADIWADYKHHNGYWTVSLYSKKVDVSEIAAQFTFRGRRGSGHKQAAGFQVDPCPTFLFSPIDEAVIAKTEKGETDATRTSRAEGTEG